MRRKVLQHNRSGIRIGWFCFSHRNSPFLFCSQVSCQAAELSKWKSRAIKLKAKTKPELDKPGSPCTPTKRGLCSATESSNLLSSPKRFLTSREVLDSPSKVPVSSRKVLDSPKSSALDSPKSRFFDVGGTSELLSRTFPKQFFDNSNLGLPQGKFLALTSSFLFTLRSTVLCSVQVLLRQCFKTQLCSAEVSQVPGPDFDGN